jgi:hypothetical protein
LPAAGLLKKVFLLVIASRESGAAISNHLIYLKTGLLRRARNDSIGAFSTAPLPAYFGRNLPKIFLTAHIFLYTVYNTPWPGYGFPHYPDSFGKGLSQLNLNFIYKEVKWPAKS